MEPEVKWTCVEKSTKWIGLLVTSPPVIYTNDERNNIYVICIRQRDIILLNIRFHVIVEM